MIDYAKIENYDEFSTVPKLIQSGILKEHQKKKGIYVWHNFEINVKRNDGKITLSGSLHKLYNHLFKNDGFANFSDFTFSQLIQTIQVLIETFKINPFTAYIRSVEFGVNVVPPCESIRLVLAARTLKNTQPERLFQDYFSRFRFQQYIVKLYDKAGQYRKDYGLKGELLRVEIHVDRMDYLKKYGIRYLADLLNVEKIFLLYKPLLSAISEIQFSPGIYSFPKLTKPEQTLINKLTDFDFVVNTIKSNKDKINYYNRGFDSILCNYSIPDNREILRELVYQKWEELTISDSKTSTFLTGYLNQFLQVQSNQNFNLINTSNTGLIGLNSIRCIEREDAPSGRTLKEKSPKEKIVRYCHTCGKPLHPDQHPKSIYCSAKIVGDKPAHKCRNDRSNKKHNRAKKIGRVTSKIEKVLSTPSLFDQGPFIRLPLGLNSIQG